MGPQEPPLWTTGTSHHTGGQFWTPIGGQYSTPVDNLLCHAIDPKRVATHARQTIASCPEPPNPQTGGHHPRYWAGTAHKASGLPGTDGTIPWLDISRSPAQPAASIYRRDPYRSSSPTLSRGVNRCSAARTQIGVRVPSVASSRMRSQLPSKRRRTLSVLASRGCYQRSARCWAWSSSTPEDRRPHSTGLTPRPKLRVIRCDSWVTGTLCVVEMCVAVKDARRCHLDVDAARGLLLLPRAAVANRDRSYLARRNAVSEVWIASATNERPRSGVIRKTNAHREFYRP